VPDNEFDLYQIIAQLETTDQNLLSFVVKANIIIEHVSFLACAKSMDEPVAFFGKDASKHVPLRTKLNLMQALYGSRIQSDCYAYCKKLSGIRNDLAHKVKPDLASKMRALLAVSGEFLGARGILSIDGLEDDQLGELFFHSACNVASEIAMVAFPDELASIEATIVEQLNRSTQDLG
jgi:hypothetical protein